MENRYKSYSSNQESAMLDVDDVISYGPETVTIYDQNEDSKYSYYIHDYTNKYDEESFALANSQASVNVYVGETLVRTYHVPSTGTGTVWHVFDYDAVTGTIQAVNTLSNCASPQDVG